MYEEYCTDFTRNKNVRYNHRDCGDRRGRLYVRFTGFGWVMYCHNCGWKRFQRAANLPAETVKRAFIEKGTSNDPSKVYLPKDCRDPNPVEKAWLYKYGVTDDEIRKYQIKYSDESQRLILPVYHNENLVMYQARATKPDQAPKYLTVGKRNFFITNFKNPIICFVEDIVSAIKVGRYVCACALIGSYVPDEVFSYMTNKTEFRIWLDYDKRREALKYYFRVSQLTGIKGKLIKTELDPKEYSGEQIKEYLTIS